MPLAAREEVGGSAKPQDDAAAAAASRVARGPPLNQPWRMRCASCVELGVGGWQAAFPLSNTAAVGNRAHDPRDCYGGMNESSIRRKIPPRMHVSLVDLIPPVSDMPRVAVIPSHT